APRRTAHVSPAPRPAADREAAGRQPPRPGVEPSLKRARALAGVAPPVPDLHLLLDRRHARDLENEPRGRHRLLEYAPRGGVELGGIAHQREFRLSVVPQRHEPRGLGPWEAATYPHGALGAAAGGPEPAVRPPLEGERANR